VFGSFNSKPNVVNNLTGYAAAVLTFAVDVCYEMEIRTIVYTVRPTDPNASFNNDGYVVVDFTSEVDQSCQEGALAQAKAFSFEWTAKNLRKYQRRNKMRHFF
jgi:hypothetical protein